MTCSNRQSRLLKPTDAHDENIRHYHTGNGRFKDKATLESIQKYHQIICFQGVRNTSLKRDSREGLEYLQR